MTISLGAAGHLDRLLLIDSVAAAIIVFARTGGLVLFAGGDHERGCGCRDGVVRTVLMQRFTMPANDATSTQISAPALMTKPAARRKPLAPKYTKEVHPPAGCQCAMRKPRVQ